MQHIASFVLSLFLIAGYSTYSSASGTINFGPKMPDEFEFCGEKIGRDSDAYKALDNWFRNNTTGWYQSSRKYELELTYMSRTMRVNMIYNKVIVSYASNTSVGQYVRAAKTSGFHKLCGKANPNEKS